MLLGALIHKLDSKIVMPNIYISRTLTDSTE